MEFYLTDIDIIPQNDDVTDYFLVSRILHINDFNYMALRYRPGRTIVPATKDRFTNNLPDLSQLLYVPITTDEFTFTYLTNLLSCYNPTCSLRSQNSGLLVVPRIAKSTKGGRTFSYFAPKLWISLPDNVQGSDTLSLFKSRLKTHLFSQAFI